MKVVFNEISRLAIDLRSHPFINLALNAPESKAKERLQFWAPGFIHLSMTFRDINNLFLIKKDSDDVLSSAISKHAAVDNQHWKLFLHDLSLLGINKKIYLNDAIPLIWNDDFLFIRKYMYAFIANCEKSSSSVYRRAALMEAAEAGVRTFFSAIQHTAEAFRKQYGASLEYFGPAHIKSETENPLDTDVFEEICLDGAERKACLELVENHFREINIFLDKKYAISKDRPEFNE